MSINGEACNAKLKVDANWLTKLRLYFKDFEYHLSQDGFVLYKRLGDTLYVYASAHFVFEKHEHWDGGYKNTWSN